MRRSHGRDTGEDRDTPVTDMMLAALIAAGMLLVASLAVETGLFPGLLDVAQAGGLAGR